MFEHLGPRSGRQLPSYTVVSVAMHAAFVLFILGLAALKARAPARKQVEVAFIGPGRSKPPPPPPPPAGKKHLTPKRKPVLARAEVPRPALEAPKVIEPPPVEEEEDDGVLGGVEGGVAGGVVGGVLGGQVKSTGGGGGGMAPAEKVQPKNVPIFVIQRDMIRQVSPRMSEVFNLQHRGQTVTGMYKVCVDTDGSVYEVTPVKSVPGADDEIIEGIKAGWLYKAQQVPVCFLYNMVVTVQQ